MTVSETSPAARSLSGDEGGIVVVYPPDRERLAARIKALAGEAAEKVTAETGLAVPREVTIIFCATGQEFAQRTGHSFESVYACASSSEPVIYVNGDAVARGPSDDTLGRVLTHELSHLVFNVMIPERLPRWLEEGLAMHVAGQMSLSRHITLAYAKIFNKTIPLKQLDLGFPGDEHAMDLAYAQSYSVVDYLIATRFGSLAALIRSLAASSGPESLAAQFWYAEVREIVEVGWLAHLGTKWRNIILIVTGSTVLWFGVTLLFILAYLKKRKQKKLMYEQWEREGDRFI